MLFSVPSKPLTEERFCCRSIYKVLQMQTQCILQLSIQCISGSLACSFMSFFLLFFSCPEETEDLHKQQSSISKIACNAPQHIRSVAINHNKRMLTVQKQTALHCLKWGLSTTPFMVLYYTNNQNTQKSKRNTP